MSFDAIAALIANSESSLDVLSNQEQALKSILDGDEALGAIWRGRRAATLYLALVSGLSSADSEGLRGTWYNYERDQDVPDCMRAYLRPPAIEVQHLPLYTFVLQFSFILAQPYISRDDQDFYIVDNPVRKEKISGVPFVAASTWKGCLRHVYRQLKPVAPLDNPQEQHVGTSGDDRLRTPDALEVRLFGNDKEIEDGDEGALRAGRLRFFPSFLTLDQTGLQRTRTSVTIINPHDRTENVGKLPVPIECAPRGLTGYFTLLYTPDDDILDPDSERRARAIADLRMIGLLTPALFTLYGFGAKTSDSFGLAAETITGSVHVHVAGGTSASGTLSSFAELTTVLDATADGLLSEDAR